MSRSAARKAFSAGDLAKAKSAGTPAWQSEQAEPVIDEIPASYKDIDIVMDD